MRRSSSGSVWLYNIITLVMLGVSGAVTIAMLMIASDPSTPVNPFPPRIGPLPTVYRIPSSTPTIPRPTLPPTWTATLTGTPAASATLSPTPTITYTPTDTATPLPTPTYTPTPSFTPTITPLASDTPTPSPTPPYPYALRNSSIEYRANFANKAGCDWAGIAGQVLKENGKHKTGLIVHVWNPGLDERVKSGDAPDYGESGWERSVNDHPVDVIFYVQLEDSSLKPLSEVVAVQMIASCDKNLAYLVFQEQ
jgi:hypothetical protein